MGVDPVTQKEIHKITGRVLREAGITAAPVSIETLLDFLRVHREFFDLEDPSLWRTLKHKAKVQKHKFKRVFTKSRLAALWLPDENRILVDQTLPEPKKAWASFHDATHTILPWHKDFFLGDTAQTLNPAFQEDLEAEANFGASNLMFCGPEFSKDALSLPAEWSSLAKLKKRYQTSWVTTLRRFVRYTHDRPMAAIISTAPWMQKPTEQETRCRHFVPSPRFEHQFGNVTADCLLDTIDNNITKRSGGPVGDFEFPLTDDNGKSHEFRGESFFNQHYVLTLLVQEDNAVARSVLVSSSGQRFRAR